jgi:hypothetical protein
MRTRVGHIWGFTFDRDVLPLAEVVLENVDENFVRPMKATFDSPRQAS